MSRVASIIARVDAALSSTTAFDRQVYARTVQQVGGDKLIGRPGAVTNLDTLLIPQPYANRIGRERVPGGHVPSETLVSPSGAMLLADDYEILVSATAITLATLQEPSLLVVFKNPSGQEEVLSLLDFETVSLNSTDIMFTLYCRSVARS